jgi:hypothetical protein
MDGDQSECTARRSCKTARTYFQYQFRFKNYSWIKKEKITTLVVNSNNILSRGVAASRTDEKPLDV